MNAACKPVPVVVDHIEEAKIQTSPSRTKTRIKVRAHFDRAGGMVDGIMTIDKVTGVVTVREKGMRREYSMRLSEVVDIIARRGLGVG